MKILHDRVKNDNWMGRGSGEDGGLMGPLVVIVGETASGKSALGMEIARKFNGEIICADSWTVRREVNIGTAKPTQTEQDHVKHHLIDIAKPCADFTAAVFKRLANKAIADIYRRNKLPVMVGGTGLYVDGVLFDFNFLPHADRGQRAKLNQLDIPQLREIIRENDLDDSNVDIRNKRRLIRLIETGGMIPSRGELRPNTLVIGLKIGKGELEQRIRLRTEAMIRDGLEHETKLLLEKYGRECEALKGIGYKEWLGYFDGEYDIEQTKQKIISSTLKLAKRQRTWFKRHDFIQWVANKKEALTVVKNFLNNS